MRDFKGLLLSVINAKRTIGLRHGALCQLEELLLDLGFQTTLKSPATLGRIVIGHWPFVIGH